MKRGVRGDKVLYGSVINYLVGSKSLKTCHMTCQKPASYTLTECGSPPGVNDG